MIPSTMNAAAPDGAPQRRIRLIIRKLPVPPCLGEALRRVTLANTTMFKRKPPFMSWWRYPAALASQSRCDNSSISGKGQSKKPSG